MDTSCNQTNIEIIQRQTDYTEEEIIEKLKEFDNNPLLVIKNYLGVEKKPEKKKTLNQEIYTQIRKHMDNS